MNHFRAELVSALDPEGAVVTLDEQAVYEITEQRSGGTATLLVRGTNNDIGTALDFTDTSTTEVIDGVTYNVYTSGNARVLFEVGINVSTQPLGGGGSGASVANSFAPASSVFIGEDGEDMPSLGGFVPFDGDSGSVGLSIQQPGPSIRFEAPQWHLGERDGDGRFEQLLPGRFDPAEPEDTPLAASSPGPVLGVAPHLDILGDDAVFDVTSIDGLVDLPGDGAFLNDSNGPAGLSRLTSISDHAAEANLFELGESLSTEAGIDLDLSSDPAAVSIMPDVADFAVVPGADELIAFDQPVALADLLDQGVLDGKFQPPVTLPIDSGAYDFGGV